MINRTQYNGDLVMDFVIFQVIFQGTRFDDAFVQKSCCDLGGDYDFSMAEERWHC